MEIRIYPLKQLYTILADKPENGVAVVSSAYEAEEDKLTIPHIVEIYEDLDREVPGRSFSREAACRMAQFIRRIPKTTQTVFCACNAGQCRSTAVAAAISLYYGMDDMPIWEDSGYKPNPLVFTLLCESLGVEMTDEMLDFRLETNYRAFRTAIRKY